jgi:hypothetical protein
MRANFENARSAEQFGIVTLQEKQFLFSAE